MPKTSNDDDAKNDGGDYGFCDYFLIIISYILAALLFPLRCEKSQID